MLFLNDKQVTAEELCSKFNVPLDKIKREPLFENLKKFKDKNTGLMRSNNGTGIRSRFYANDPDTGLKVCIQYAKNQNHKTEANGVSRVVYSPRFVFFDGVKFNLQEDIDLAVYLYLHPMSSDSPVPRKNISKAYKFVDKAREAIAEMDKLDNLEKAMYHAKNTDIETLRIISKGVRIGRVDEMTDEEVRIEMRKYANRNPERYMSVIANNVVKTEGRIRDLVDKGLIVLKSNGIIRHWEWKTEEFEGTVIGEPITNRAQDAEEYLINYILKNIDQYIDKLFRTQSNVSARETARKKLENIQADFGKEATVGEVDSSNISAVLTLPNIEDNNDVKDFFDKMGYKKLPVDVKTLKDAIADGTVNIGNVEFFMDKNFKKV